MAEQRDDMGENIILSALKAQQDRQLSVDAVLRGTEILENREAAEQAEREQRLMEQRQLEQQKLEQQELERARRAQAERLRREERAAARAAGSGAAREAQEPRAGAESARVAQRKAAAGDAARGHAAEAAFRERGAEGDGRRFAEEAARASQPVAQERPEDAGITRVMASVRDEDVRAYRAFGEQAVEGAGAGAAGQERAAERAPRRSEPIGGAQGDIARADTSGIDVINTSPALYGSYAGEAQARGAHQRASAPGAAAIAAGAGAAYKDAAWCSEAIARIIANIETVVVGKRDVVELAVLALIVGGHVLIEDLPGTGKTSLASALARSIDCRFKRIQFTPDVMPSEITGFSMLDQKSGAFRFQPGAVMANIVLADEINRASAKTQSAMLEAMEEQQVSVEGTTYRLADPFMVIATQNPLEQYGVYPLPEAQLDRFLVKMSMGYLGADDEARAIMRSDGAKVAIGPVAVGDDVLALRAQAQGIYVSPALARYAVLVAGATRSSRDCEFGASPRGSKALVELARARALFRGRDYATPDDVKSVALPVLCHRIGLTREALAVGRTVSDVIAAVLETVPVPEMGESEAKGLWT